MNAKCIIFFYFSVNIRLVEKVFIVTAGLGFCNANDWSYCLVNIDFLKEARIPFPSIDVKENLVWPRGIV